MTSDTMHSLAVTRQAPEKPERYMFDEVFALDTGRRKAPPAITPDALEEAVSAARDEGHSAGLTEGRRQAERAIEGRLTDAVGALVAAMARFVESVEARRSETEAEAVRVAMTALDRLVPALVEREPTAELAALLRECLSGVRNVPHIAIRVSEDLVEPMRDRFDRVAAEAGFTGRVVVIGEPNIAPGDGRIDWADGGTVRDMTETRRAIEAAVDDFMAARPATTVESPASADWSPTRRDDSNE